MLRFCLLYLEDFLANVFVINWSSAEWAQVEIGLVIVDVIVVPLAEASHMHHMIFVACELGKLFARLHLASADHAVKLFVALL